ncbi:MAG: histidinol-phosphate transaminase [Brevibacterium sp.]|uniref:histidinol-phosphate transaminase n=1 Tax=Brevibacterium sp. TaxID=1701 RepID=UPI002648F762|nr:histidinol-phosphate transaminase [Brevibacterium sp.]MDN5806083.1 histidinol-phosphate transaminase [Brevibacterium sp.]MDN5832608.1 histidinol-phosphate transaminase [Brevibacterium sp.]MDN5875758.1 histidinol-phosphate transaminase [Brevibacterium sp.]MDN5909132.1 histidinol-phosphate transaminase [Brevibacterium sp.]MDN6123203.1 histidinol-phosphate transaminase [Brevibacterium sp.]
MNSPDNSAGSPSTPRLRASLETFPPYVPGKAPKRIEGLAPFKLSSNENCLEPLPAVVDAMVAHAKDPALYPDDAALALRTDLAERLGVSIDELVVTTGASELLVALTQITSDATTEAIYPWPSFEMYPQTTGLAGSKRVEVPLREDGRHDLDAMAAAITDRTSLIILCSPNNPTGPALRDEEVRRFLTQVPKNVLVALDEAYWEFATAESVVDGVDLVADHPNVVLVRTFSKAHALAGLRVGYAHAHEAVIQGLLKAVIPFGVTDMSQAAALESLRHSDEVDVRAKEIAAVRDDFAHALRDQGWDVPEAQGNFVWLPLGELSSAFEDACVEQAVAVRNLGDGVRISIGQQEGLDRVLAVAAAFHSEHFS